MREEWLFRGPSRHRGATESDQTGEAAHALSHDVQRERFQSESEGTKGGRASRKHLSQHRHVLHWYDCACELPAIVPSLLQL